MSLSDSGFTLISPRLPAETLHSLRESLFVENHAGRRCLLDEPRVRSVAVALKRTLISAGHLPARAVAIQAIALDKTTGTNWKVPWHQDLMFPFARPVSNTGYTLPSTKDGINYARPPHDVLENLLAVRLHLDPCGIDNGPLRVSPGTHRRGILRTYPQIILKFPRARGNLPRHGANQIMDGL